MSLETLLIPERSVEAGGEVFRLTPFRFRHMLKAMPHFGALMELISAKEVNGRLQLDLDMDRLLTEGADHLVPLMALAAGRSEAWADGLEFEEGVRLAAAVLELNADFFVQTRAMGKGAKENLGASPVGATSSQN